MKTEIEFEILYFRRHPRHQMGKRGKVLEKMASFTSEQMPL